MHSLSSVFPRWAQEHQRLNPGYVGIARPVSLHIRNASFSYSSIFLLPFPGHQTTVSCLSNSCVGDASVVPVARMTVHRCKGRQYLTPLMISSQYIDMAIVVGKTAGYAFGSLNQMHSKRGSPEQFIP